MNNIQLFEHQIKALEDTKDKNRVAYYLDWHGAGKNFRKHRKDGPTRERY